MAVYWQGANGQIYLKGNDGKVQDMGRAWANDSKYLKAVGADTTKGSFEATRISDPNPPKPKQQDNSYLQGLQSQLSALQQQLAYQPKLAKFDVMGNFNRARSSAEQAVNPLYEKYLRDFLAKQQIQKENKGGEVNLRKQSNAMELAQSLAESGVNRGRTVEDTAAAIGKLNEQEGQMQQDTGTQFDVDRRALAEDVAARGMTTTGIAGGQMFDQQNMRNISEERQVKEFTNQRQAKQLFKSRTFEDLARGDENAKTISSQKDQAAQFDFDSYVEELAAEETQYRLDNEVKRLGDINSQSQTYATQGTQQFLASLAGAGWRPQDIALAYQVYG
jgi:hypothetical protein